MENENLNTKRATQLGIGAVMPHFTYRLVREMSLFVLFLWVGNLKFEYLYIE